MRYPLYPSGLGFQDICADFRCLGIPLDLQESHAIVALGGEGSRTIFVSPAAFRLFGAKSQEDIAQILTRLL